MELSGSIALSVVEKVHEGTRDEAEGIRKVALLRLFLNGSQRRCFSFNRDEDPTTLIF